MNKMLSALYNIYRKKNDPGTAAFHSKAIITVVTSIYLFDVFIIIQELFNTEDFLASVPLGKAVSAIIIAPIFILVYFSTSTTNELERRNNDVNERKSVGPFLLIAGSGLALFFFLAFKFGGV